MNEEKANPRVELLDHGYVELIEAWGSESGIIEAARMSTQGGFKGWGEMPCLECGGSGDGPDRIDGPGEVYQDKCNHCKGEGATVGDEKLLTYLYKNKHHTPFEMAGMTFEVQAPIFVFREWHRHRVPFSYNEASARYAPLPDLNYVPSVERLMMNAGGTNKQAGTVDGAKQLTEATSILIRARLEAHYAEAQHLYEKWLAAGVPKELARVHLPVGRYSKMRASSNLRGWLNFLTLREAPGAQYEIRVYANAVHSMLKARFPRTLALFKESP